MEGIYEVKPINDLKTRAKNVIILARALKIDETFEEIKIIDDTGIALLRFRDKKNFQYFSSKFKPDDIFKIKAPKIEFPFADVILVEADATITKPSKNEAKDLSFPHEIKGKVVKRIKPIKWLNESDEDVRIVARVIKQAVNSNTNSEPIIIGDNTGITLLRYSGITFIPPLNIGDPIEIEIPSIKRFKTNAILTDASTIITKPRKKEIENLPSLRKIKNRFLEPEKKQKIHRYTKNNRIYKVKPINELKTGDKNVKIIARVLYKTDYYGYGHKNEISDNSGSIVLRFDGVNQLDAFKNGDPIKIEIPKIEIFDGTVIIYPDTIVTKLKESKTLGLLSLGELRRKFFYKKKYIKELKEKNENYMGDTDIKIIARLISIESNPCSITIGDSTGIDKLDCYTDVDSDIYNQIVSQNKIGDPIKMESSSFYGEGINLDSDTIVTKPKKDEVMDLSSLDEIRNKFITPIKSNNKKVKCNNK